MNEKKTNTNIQNNKWTRRKENKFINKIDRLYDAISRNRKD